MKSWIEHLLKICIPSIESFPIIFLIHLCECTFFIKFKWTFSKTRKNEENRKRENEGKRKKEERETNDEKEES